MTNPARPRRVVAVTYPGMELLDLTGPLNVFTAAQRLDPNATYDVRLVGQTRGPVPTAGGVELFVRHTLKGIRGEFDMLLVPGALSVERGPGLGVVPHLRRLAPRARRVVGVCSGALLLGLAGLLDGRRAATHWAACSKLAQLFPTCRVDHEAIYVRDGKVWTSAGVSAGVDLALALVEHDFGGELALEVARWLVVYLRRPGGQSQFSAPLAAQTRARPSVSDVVAWAREHLQADLSVERLAKRAAMSPRNFARVFAKDTGATPARFVERLRVEAARGLLEEQRSGLTETAEQCGFGNVETLHRAFRRVVGVTPKEYQRRFSPRSARAPSA